jgi:dTDP-4-dehydrorhamnose reductase
MGRTKILVIGSSSLIGSQFVEKYGGEYEISAIGRRNMFQGSNSPLSSFTQVDVRNGSSLKEAVASSKAEIVVNYAAETGVDGCEVEAGNKNGSVFATNTSAVVSIAQVCKERNVRFYQISTDFVFDGSSGPYSEEDTAGPVHSNIGWYGFTKYLAEQELKRISPPGYCVIRVSYPYRANFRPRSDFARNIVDLFRKGKLYPMFTDQIFSPTLVDDISDAVNFLISKSEGGIYHVACKFPTSPFCFAAKLLATCFPRGFYENAIMKGSIIDFNMKQEHSPRPIKGGLLSGKIEKLGFELKTYEEGIKIFAGQWKVLEDDRFSAG